MTVSFLSQILIHERLMLANLAQFSMSRQQASSPVASGPRN